MSQRRLFRTLIESLSASRSRTERERVRAPFRHGAVGSPKGGDGSEARRG